MAIIGAGLKLAKQLLKNKGLQKAINVTTTQTNKLKTAVGKADLGGKASSAITKAKPLAKKVTQKAKEVGSKAGSAIASKTPEGVKKVAKTVGKGAAGVAGGIAAVGGGIGAGTGAVIGGTTARLGGKALRASKDAIAKARGKPTKLGGTADRNIGKAEALNRKVDNTFAGMAAGAAIGGITGVAGAGVLAGSLTASMVKSSTPKEAQFKQEKLPDGRFVTGYSDAYKNSVYSQNQLSSKETDEVRSLVAILDSIILSEDPSKRRVEFTETAQLLGGKYGISHITGKNLSIMMPTVMGNNRTLR